MRFIVIEGDNGTGKDTLALRIKENLGHRIITNESNIKEINRQAKCYTGKKRIQEFLKYGKICSDIVTKAGENVILVRYWLSTLASAYADNIYTYEQVCEIENNICSKLYTPDIIICLWCDFETRVERIKARKNIDFDDITVERNEKYKWFLNQYQIRTNVKWINIDTSNKNKDEVFKEACKYINK